VAVLKLQALLSPPTRIISYTSISSEVDPFVLFPNAQSLVVYTIEPDPSLDPAHEASQSETSVASAPGLLFIPGRRFDATGTRHGKGFGWYDRFLSKVPSSWIRVGFCFDEQFSATVLTREPWDEPMDFVCVVNKMNELLECNETYARAPGIIVN
jgi:5-formyltetrahydrofolate cyclo-ligase